MGMTYRVTQLKAELKWPVLRACLAQRGCPVQMRMIDGQLAFPDAEPPETWQELRLGAAAGMLTLRSEPNAISIVIWGNADESLRELAKTVAQAIAELSGGTLEGIL